MGASESNSQTDVQSISLGDDAHVLVTTVYSETGTVVAVTVVKAGVDVFWMFVQCKDGGVEVRTTSPYVPPISPSQDGESQLGVDDG